MKHVARAYLWRCPHCGGRDMQLNSGIKHLRRKHIDCWSCHMEMLLLEAMMEGKGFIVPAAELPFHEPAPRESPLLGLAT